MSRSYYQSVTQNFCLVSCMRMMYVLLHCLSFALRLKQVEKIDMGGSFLSLFSPGITQSQKIFQTCIESKTFVSHIYQNRFLRWFSGHLIHFQYLMKTMSKKGYDDKSWLFLKSVIYVQCFSKRQTVLKKVRQS